jgi:hypothetical protein
MKFLKKLFLFVLVIAAVLAAGSQLLPSNYRVERSLIIRTKAENVFPLINNVKRWPEWSAWNTEMDPTLVFSYEGPEEGVGAVSKWEGKKAGQGMMTLTESDPAKGIKYELSFEHGRYVSRGWVSLLPAGTDTKVLMGFGGELSRNPMDRIFGLFMEKMVGPDFEKGLAKLKKQLEAK